LREAVDWQRKADAPASAAQKALIIEDDEKIALLLKMYLEKDGFATDIAGDGISGLSAVRSARPDIVLLDLMLPELDGWEVCRSIRQESAVPVIMITAKGETIDKVQGLEAGADDYITKPFDMKEVLARVRAVLRRYSADERKKRRIEYHRLAVDMDAFALLIDGKPVDTPPKELELLYFLASSPGRVFTRKQLLDDVWGFDYLGDSRTVDVHIKRLREKLEGVSERWRLKTVWGVGYKFELSP
jgi:DNA-binding response OmpR family regulator